MNIPPKGDIGHFVTNNPDFLRFKKYLERAEIPERNSKFSNKIYSNHLLLYYLALGAETQSAFRRTERFVRRRFPAERAPDHSTLHKFLRRIPPSWLRTALAAFTKRVRQLWLDGTGFIQHFTKYFAFATDKMIVRNAFKKAIFAVSVGGVVVDACFMQGAEAPALQKLIRTDVRRVYADKGYDSEENFSLCYSLGIEPIIAIRSNAKTGLRARLLRTRGARYGRLYAKRSFVESIMHSVKCLVGEDVRARKTDMQEKEILVKLLAYNFERFGFVGFVWLGFRQT
jgi:hypothetical protein